MKIGLMNSCTLKSIPFPLPPGFQINNLTIIEYCTEGSDTVNYKVMDGKNNLKILKEYYPTSSRQSTLRVEQPNIDMFMFGANLFKIINHPVLMSIDSVFKLYGTCYVVGEYIDGVIVKDYTNKVKFQMIEDILNCLREFHFRGYTIKSHGLAPKDVMITNDRQIKIVDFSSVKKISAKYSSVKDYCITSDLLNCGIE